MPMFTETAVITTDSNGDGSKDITKPKPFIFANLRGYQDPDRIEFFRLYYQILDQANVVQESSSSSSSSSTPSSGGGGGVLILSPPELTTGILVKPNQKLRIKIAAGVSFASKTFKVSFDWRFV